MTNLTEKLRKGELPEGDYFITNGNEIYPDYYDSAEGFLKTAPYGVQQILAEVPSFEQWFNQGDYVAFLEEENIGLKKLLKECKDEIEYLRKHYKGSINHLKNNTRLDKEINQVLGEE